MSRLMIATVSSLKQTENGDFKNVKENYIVPGDTFSTAEDYVYSKLNLQGDVVLHALKEEIIDSIIYESEDLIESSWFKSIVSHMDIAIDKKVKYVMYINALDMKSANAICFEHIEAENLTDAEVKSVVLTTVLDVYEN